MDIRFAAFVVALWSAGSSLGAQTVHYDLSGVAADDQFGFAVASAGDVDADGFEDWIVGAPESPLTIGAQPGYAVLFSGVDGSVIRTLVGLQNGAGFGYAVAGIGDLNKDGADDVIVGSPFHADPVKGADVGNVRVFSGADGSLLRNINGNAQGIRFGFSVAGVGDVNQDSFVDYAIGSPRDMPAFGGAIRPGSVRIQSGKNTFLLVRVEGSSDQDQFGAAIARIGDLDGDGVADIAIGAPQGGLSGAPGYVRLHSGRNGTKLLDIPGVAPDETGFGTSVGDAGDVDGDGKGDVVIGAPLSGVAEAGSVVVVSGANGMALHTLVGAPGQHFGASVDGAGDVDADGRADFLVGIPDHDAAGPSAGRATVFSGLTGSALVTLDGDTGGKRLGRSVAGNVDLDGDGTPDLVAGAPQMTVPGNVPGMARVFSGPALSLFADRFQVSLAAGGTMTLDLRGGNPNAGALYWMFGSASGTSPGLFLGGTVTLPLVYDAYTFVTLVKPGAKYFQGFRGALDVAGVSTASIVVPPAMDPGLAGITLHHAFLAANLLGFPEFASNAVPLDLVP
jgi:hypothetical protein